MRCLDPCGVTMLPAQLQQINLTSTLEVPSAFALHLKILHPYPATSLLKRFT